jgi:hypothetical protein
VLTLTFITNAVPNVCRVSCGRQCVSIVFQNNNGSQRVLSLVKVVNSSVKVGDPEVHVCKRGHDGNPY